MQVAFFSNCDCDSVTVATRFFTFLPFYPFTLSLATVSSSLAAFRQKCLKSSDVATSARLNVWERKQSCFCLVGL